MKIAIVNDTVIAVEALRRVLLTVPEHQVAWIAKDGAEAVAKCAKDTPDLILMDLKMQLLSGLEATRKIRRSAEIGGVPIIFVSGCGEAGYRRAALDAGGNEYLVKPIVFEHLENVIAKYVGGDAAKISRYSDGD